MHFQKQPGNEAKVIFSSCLPFNIIEKILGFEKLL